MKGEPIPYNLAPVPRPSIGGTTESIVTVSVGQALTEVSSILAMVMSMGNNDYERSAIENIISKLQRSEYSDPSIAITEAYSIKDNKLDR